MWYECKLPPQRICDYSRTGCPDKGGERCTQIRINQKPEGIAVELIDGCIRILDFLGYVGAEITDQDDTPTEIEELWTDLDDPDLMDDLNTIGRLISFLHKATSDFIPDGPDDEIEYLPLVVTMKAALCWVHKQGLDPLALLLEKHNYNKVRPYKHGKRF